MAPNGHYVDAGSTAKYSIKGLTGSVNLQLEQPIEGRIQHYDDDRQLFYVHFLRSDNDQKELKEELAKMNPAKLSVWDDSESDKDMLALFDNKQRLARVLIQGTAEPFKVFDIDSGLVHSKTHRNHLYKIPKDSNLRSFAPQVVPIVFHKYNTDLLMDTSCLNEVQVKVSLHKGEEETFDNFQATHVDVFLENSDPLPLVSALQQKNEFKKHTMDASAELSCCFPENQVCGRPAIKVVPGPPAEPTQSGMDHTLLTCIVVGGAICAIIIVVFAAMYLYKRYGSAISERHRREHHGHRRHRNGSQQNSDPVGSPSSSNKREPLPFPSDAPPPATIPNESVLAKLPQYSVVESPHNYSQVNRNISPMVQENSMSPNRAMTPLKTVEMSTQTHTEGSATRSAEPLHDDDASSTKVQPSGSRMSAGSSTSELSEATLQPSLHSLSHHRSPKVSVAPLSSASSFEIGVVQPRYLPAAARVAAVAPPTPRTTTRATRTTAPSAAVAATSDLHYLSTTGPTMADSVVGSSDEDEDSVTRSVEDCERVLAAYKAPAPSAATTASAPGSAHRTKSRLSTFPLPSTSITHLSHTDDYRSDTHRRSCRPHLISLPERSPRREEEKKAEGGEEEAGGARRTDFSRFSIPSDLLPARTQTSTNTNLSTAARRESTISWLADSTQCSLGRSMNDDEFSL